MTKTLYVNGDSHAAGTYLEFSHNHEKCFSSLLAKKYNLIHKNDAIAGGSNSRIIRTSKEYLKDADAQNTVVLIGWSTFERTEWLVNGQWHQICGQPQYEIKEKYLGTLWKNYTASFHKSWEKDNNKEERMFYLSKTIEAQYQIKEFSEWLLERDFKHLFFHAHGSFFYKKSIFEIEWPNNIWFQDKPYDPTISFCNYSLSKGYQPDHWYHFDYNAHRDYADFIEPELEKLLG